MQLITKCLIWLQRRSLKAKLESGCSLTLSESLTAVSDPKLRDLIASRNHPVVVQLPRNVVIRGADNVVFEDNVRIHSEQNMAITSRQILTINDPDLKQESFVGRDRLEASFEERLRKLESDAKKAEQGRRLILMQQGVIDVTPPKCIHHEHKKEKKHASSSKAGRYIKGTSGPRANDGGGRKPRHVNKRKSTTQKG